MMDSRLLDAAASGDATMMKHLALHDPAVLLGTTPQGNTCLHISAAHGHNGFCMDVMALNRSLLSAVNNDRETPLVAAVTSGRTSTTLASSFLRCYRDLHLSEAILMQDKQGNNALHHAIRSGHRELALELIAAEPALSKAANKYDESPMFIAVMRNYKDVFEKLLEIPDSAHGGMKGQNALHAAVRNGNSAIAKQIMETRPALATEEDNLKFPPLHLAVTRDKIDVLSVLLDHDRSLGYVANSDGYPLLNSAAFRGHVGVARELLKHCPDAPFCNSDGRTCLHEAVGQEKMKFVDFILGSPQFGRLINMRNEDGDTALHLAVQKCNSKMVAALLLHPDIDVTVLNNNRIDATWKLSNVTDHSKTLNWNEVSMLILKADPQGATNIYNVRREAYHKMTKSARDDIKSLTQTYTGNTSLVAILIATITFAAAFTLPGGYSTDAGTEGLPIMARKFAFKAFLISDTLAMCSSLAVAFVCIIARWEDLEFLLHYRSFIKKLMWFAYMATTTAFATGLYTVLAPRLLWLAVAVCTLMSLLPILTKILGDWPILKLRFRLGRNFNSELLDMV
ncbi:ankyrin repeat-containing protein At5g02620-like isoform X2 [Miscanthus floridulus]